MECYTLFSGSSGNCIYLKEGKTEILIDAGGSMRQIEKALCSVSSSPQQISGIFVTHEHGDHTKALPMLCKYFSIPLYIQRKVAKELYLSLLSHGGDSLAAAFARCVRTVNPGEEYEVGDFVVTPFRTPHDSVESQGFVIGDRLLGIATDLGHVSEEVRSYLIGCENVILESNHDLDMLWDGPYPPYLKDRVASEHGHLNNVDCADFAKDLLQNGCRNYTLYHLSKENNTSELALETTLSSLNNLGAKEGIDYSLRAALRCEVTKVL